MSEVIGESLQLGLLASWIGELLTTPSTVATGHVTVTACARRNRKHISSFPVSARPIRPFAHSSLIISIISSLRTILTYTP